jgi:hypothetical protein
VRVAKVVQTIGNAPRTVGRKAGEQIDHLAIRATAIDQPSKWIAPCWAAFAADDAQLAEPGTKIVESDGAVARHDDTSRHGNARRPPVLLQLWSVRDL